LNNYDVRPGLEKYGATAYFNDKQQLVQIYYSNELKNVTKENSNGDAWEHAKWVYKCSGITGVTLKDHLVGLHFMASNFLAMAEAEHLGRFFVVFASLVIWKCWRSVGVVAAECGQE
jgi:hypothetical protein